MKNPRQTGKPGIRAARQAGISLTEAILGIAIMGGGLGIVAKLQKENIDRINNQVAARQMATIRTAAERHVRDNYAAVLATIPNTGNRAVIPDDDLRNWLPDSMFNGTQIVNSPYNGDYVINVRNVGPGASGQPRVEMTVVTTGGRPIPDAALPQVAADLGANGGFRAATNSLYDPDTVRGAYGGWQVPVADIATAPAPGSVVGFAYFGDGAVLSDFLYRNPVPGQPEAQRMNANIDNNNFGLANVAQIGGNVDTANPAIAPVAPPANTVRFGGVTAGTNGFARGDVSIEANNVNATNLAAQGDVSVFDANNVERGRMSGATQAVTLGAAPGGATTVIADGAGQTVTVRDGARDRAQLTGTGQVRGFDAAGTETVRADAVAQNIRVGNAAGNRTEMTGGGLFSAFDNTGVLRARISGNDGSLRLSNNTGEKITADASTQRLAMRNAANNETIVADGAGQTVTVRDGARDRAQITSGGIFSAWDNNGLLRARIDSVNGSLTLNRNNAGVAQESLFLDGQNTSMRFGVDGQNTDTVSLSRADIAADQTRLRLQIGDNFGADDAFEIGTIPFTTGVWRPTMRSDNAGALSAASSVNSGSVTLNPTDGGIEIGSGNDDSSYIDFKGNGNLAADFTGRIAHQDSTGLMSISSANGLFLATVVSAGSTCANATAIARDAQGNLLTCRGGVWRLPKPLAPTLQAITETDGYASCPANTLRVACSGSREVNAQDTCKEENCGYVGTVPVGTDSCKTGIDSGNGTEPTVTAYCLSFNDSSSGANNSGGNGTVSTGNEAEGADYWQYISSPNTNITCPDGYVAAGVSLEAATWSNNVDNHSGPEVDAVLCRSQ